MRKTNPNNAILFFEIKSFFLLAEIQDRYGQRKKMARVYGRFARKTWASRVP
jgi:hypothetical protein